MNERAKLRFFCDGLPREIWRRCKDELRCLKCTKRYSDWRSLRKHMNFFCQMEPLYPCPYCPHRARIPTLLKYHIVREHVGPTSIEETRFDPLAQQFEDLGEYVQGKPNVCPKCGKGYAWKASLQRHLSTVCGTRPKFFCSLCGYKTNRKDVLVRHIRHVHGTKLE
ncbi:zinc finger and SCAN domain-containing protein 10-like [Temnothorax curvispinosus]|uniref:Zinc finger and SCAN domain-containing protein 10-like n=1 Tax=Temnothorax curvispinosus TaxID=300111 RepID=A0A6J1R4G0_9HYME|nr:zinc finger and SCAN domain-containing protein 10-like [Temnothorax curvispinosus]